MLIAILDLKGFNSYIRPQMFCMVTLVVILPLLEKRVWVVMVDLMVACFYVTDSQCGVVDRMLPFIT